LHTFGRSQKERRPEGGPKKDHFWSTFSLTRAYVRFFRKCHSELGSGFFEPTLVSAASSVTELRIETRVGRKGPERSSGRHLRVQKWRKKVNFFAKSSGKIGGVFFTEDRSSTAAPLSRMRIASRAHGGFTPPHSNKGIIIPSIHSIQGVSSRPCTFRGCSDFPCCWMSVVSACATEGSGSLWLVL